ncbi:hypothetical protein IAQ61_005988 [Plenodomus lingam]|uniref:uncharacterized protein n=1 Tax=Leptosphaeria maculans TaxID=5022 RepID=UPI0033202C8E|nr:hypothetical protein IAQ61_005988 [Plenodomus lingam]
MDKACRVQGADRPLVDAGRTAGQQDSTPEIASDDARVFGMATLFGRSACGRLLIRAKVARRMRGTWYLTVCRCLSAVHYYYYYYYHHHMVSWFVTNNGRQAERLGLELELELEGVLARGEVGTTGPSSLGEQKSIHDPSMIHP